MEPNEQQMLGVIETFSLVMKTEKTWHWVTQLITVFIELVTFANLHLILYT